MYVISFFYFILFYSIANKNTAVRRCEDAGSTNFAHFLCACMGVVIVAALFFAGVGVGLADGEGRGLSFG